MVQDVFWLIMTLIAGTLSAIYASLSVWGGRLGIGDERRRTIRMASRGLFAWMAICIAHYAIAAAH